MVRTRVYDISEHYPLASSVVFARTMHMESVWTFNSFGACVLDVDNAVWPEADSKAS